MSNFPRKFAVLFRSTGLSQDDYAAELARHGHECSGETIGNWLKGKNDPYRGAVVAIARRHGVDGNYLLFDEYPVADTATVHPLVLPSARTSALRRTPPKKKARGKRA
jgi:hypothetical protein